MTALKRKAEPSQVSTFIEIPDARVLVRRRGIYQELPLYHRGETLYFKQSGGFIRLNRSGATSVDKLTWLEIIANDKSAIDDSTFHGPAYRHREEPVRRKASA